ncbi:MAG: class I adenylate-forming enzyme family protein [Candidatus Xenobia bacterium]
MMEPRTIPGLLLRRAVEHRSRPFLFWKDQTISYLEMARRMEAAASGLQDAGVEPGDRVAVMMANSPEFLETWFGIMRAGAVAVPVNPALTAEEAGYIISDAEARVLVVDQERAGLLPSLPRVTTAFTGHIPPLQTTLASVDDPDLVACLIYTSGTTGKPKGVELTHHNYLWDTKAVVDFVGIRKEDRFLGILPLFHVNAQVATTLAPLWAGAQAVMLPKFSPDTFLQDVARYQATAFSAVPTIYSILLKRGVPADLDLSSLRFAICGAAPMPVEVFERFEERFCIKILEGYGLSEATCVSSVNPPEGTRKVGSIGVPLPGQEMRIVDEAGRPVADGQVGEIAVRGPNVMRGYFRDPEATAAVLRDGWLHTGDLGVRDQDGYFTIVGRKKDMIIRGGENIYPKEVEEVLHRLDGVQEAAVIGMPDPVWGEEVVAVVIASGQAPDSETLIAACKPHLAAFKCPSRVIFIEASEMPRTATGKIQKSKLRELLLARL